tara:strand:- start:41 stop:385 length:345 start_codon:yes stop_codon:yes gene_type:complete
MAFNGSNACFAWVNFNGSGSVSIRDDYNVSSISDNGTGDYTINFSSSMPHSNYCVVTQCTHDSSNTGHPTNAMSIKYNTAPTTGSVRLKTGPTGGANSVGFQINALYAHAAVFA